MASNWENFLKNLGEWRGSFTKISPNGEILGSTPSILNLEADDNNQAVLFRLRRFDSHDYDSPPIQDYQQEYRSLGRQNIFFATGAFSKGTLQLAPFSEFRVELVPFLFSFVILKVRLGVHFSIDCNIYHI